MPLDLFGVEYSSGEETEVEEPAVPAAVVGVPVPPVEPAAVEVPEKGKTQCRRWCFTLNQVRREPLRLPWTDLPIGSRYLVFQKEVGSLGTEHYQGYIEFEKQTSLPAVKVALESNTVSLRWAVADAEINKRYCSKCCSPCYTAKKEVDCDKCDRLEGPWVFGEPVSQGQRADRKRALAEVASDGYHSVLLTDPVKLCGIHSLAKEHDAAIRYQKRLKRGKVPPEIRVYTGPPGVGKSESGWFLNTPLGETGIIDTYKVPPVGRSEKLWFPDYNGQKVVIVEEFNSSVPITVLNDWFDQWPTHLPVKFGSVVSEVETWVLLSNVEPKKWYPNVPSEVRNALFSRIYDRFGLHLRWDVRKKEFVRVCHLDDPAGLYEPIFGDSAGASAYSGVDLSRVRVVRRGGVDLRYDGGWTTSGTSDAVFGGAEHS